MAADTSRTIMTGRLTKDCIATQVGQSKKITFSLANGYRKKVNGNWVDAVNFLDVELFTPQDSKLDGFLLKGKQIVLDGKIRQDRWEKDGKNYSRVYIMADTVQLIGGAEQAQKPQSAPGPEAFPDEDFDF